MIRNCGLLAFVVCFAGSFDAAAATGQVESISTELVSFPPGGAIHVLNSFGSLYVEGWDRPDVEITVTKSLERYLEPERQQLGKQALEKVRIITDRHSERELQISTIVPRGLFTRWLGGKGGFLHGTGTALDKVTGTARHPLGGKGGPMLEYQIHVPRDSRLIVHHGTGRVLVSGVTGDVEVTSTGGDVVLMLPESGAYCIDARSKLGTVSSDFEGSAHRRHIVGSGFTRAPSPQSRRICLRTRLGSITIKAVPIQGQDPAVASVPSDRSANAFCRSKKVLLGPS